MIEHVVEKTETLAAFEGDPSTDPSDELLAFPGRAMADNVAWVRDHADAETLAVWAHDAHLNRVAYRGPSTDASAPSLGRRLAERHGDDYYALGFSFARGAFQAVSKTDDGEYELGEQHLGAPLPETIDAMLYALDEPLAFIDLRNAREDERTADWFATPRAQFRTGGTVDLDTPGEHLIEYVHADAFDGLCFVAETTRARPIENVPEEG